MRGYFEVENELEEDALNDEDIDLESSEMWIPSAEDIGVCDMIDVGLFVAIRSQPSSLLRDIPCHESVLDS